MPTAKDVIRNTIGSADMILSSYVGDLNDDEVHLAPGPGMNPIAWQLGHLISAEHGWAESIQPGSSPPLPEGFDAAHSKETAAPNTFRKVASKDDYLRLWKAQNAATLAVLDALPEDRLDDPTEMPWAPTVAALLNMVGVHPLMHVGQFVAVRRKLGKPVVI